MSNLGSRVYSKLINLSVFCEILACVVQSGALRKWKLSLRPGLTSSGPRSVPALAAIATSLISSSDNSRKISSKVGTGLISNRRLAVFFKMAADQVSFDTFPS